MPVQSRRAAIGAPWQRKVRMHPRGPFQPMPVPAVEPLEVRLLLSGFAAYNDTAAGPTTHANATLYADTGVTSAGLLKDIVTGADTPVLLSTINVGVNLGGTGTNPTGGLAASIFGGYVDFTSAWSSNNLEMSGADSYTYVFENLDPGSTYEFAGTAVRGEDMYTDRWTLVTLLGADGFHAAHSEGEGIVTAGLGPNQVAIWTGANHHADQGFVVQWTEIDAGADGEFEVVSQQYTGIIPYSVDPDGWADAVKAYGLNGIRLVANVPTAPPTLVNTPATTIEAFAAVIGGEITSTGGQAPDVRIYFGDDDAGTVAANWDTWVDLGRQSSAFTALADGLDQTTTYFYRAFAENSVGPAWAPATESFTTLTATAPSVINLPAVNVGAFSASLRGEVTDTGDDAPLITIYYGTTDGGTSPAAWDYSVEVGAQSGEFLGVVDNLDPETAYVFTARARNAVGDVWATPALGFETVALPPLQITEFMADNATTLQTRTRTSPTDPFAGDYSSPDWIEIRNPTDGTAILTGYYLTDDLGNPKGWAFPAGTTIEPGGYLIVFASGDDITDPALDENGYLHTDFKLKDAGGEDLGLADPDGVILFAYEDFPPQIEDTSYGIDPESEERFFPAPTPGWDNANDVPQAPLFSVASTTFSGALVVDLTARYPTDVVHYTLNESVPTVLSPVWSGPMSLTTSTMLRAVSIGANAKSSRVVSETYIALGADVLSTSSDLPLVIVETFGDGVPGVGTYFGDTYMAFFEPGADGRAHLTDAPTLGTRAGIHIRGSSSAGFYKKQYRVEFWDEANEDRRLDLLGLPAEADWIFYGPGPYDRALINNPLMYDLSNQLGRYALRTRWVEMYLDSGGGQVTAADYVGVYAIMEVVESGDDRLDVEPLISSGAGGVPVDGGFLWKNDRGSPYVDPEVLTSSQQTYVNGWINGLQAAALSANFRDPDIGYAAWAEVDSFVDHNLLNMLAMNVDAMRLSGYYFKTDGGLIEAGPIFDFDRSLESTDGRDDNPYWWNGTGDSTRYFNDDSRVRMWWPRMFQDPDFVQRYIDRWFELRLDEFSLANVYATIDAHATLLQEAAPRDYAHWSGSRYGNFAGEIQHMKTWLTNRINWIDSQWLARPIANVAGPVVTPGTQVSLSAATGTVYYTLDGTDPRAVGGGISPGAIAASGPITTNAYTQITTRVYKANHNPSSGAPGYIATGDDWSAPLVAEYFVNPLVTSGDLVINEINYHPYDATPEELATQPPEEPDFEGNDFEFVELMNISGHTVNICGVRLTGGIEFEFPSYVLAPGQRIVVAEDLAGFTARYGTGVTVAGQWAGKLDNQGDHTLVLARSGAAVLDFTYDDGGTWPGRADGKGASLELIDPWAVPATEPERQEYLQDGANWRSSVCYGGSPGAADDSAVPIVVNEVLTHTDDPLADTIELHNTSTTETIDLGGWWLSDSWGWEWNAQNGDYQKFRIPTGTVLGPGEYVVFYQGHYVGGVMTFDDDEFDGGAKGFGLDSAHGDDVWLMKADAEGQLTHFVDHAEFVPAANGESFGRWPNATGDLYPMISRTLPGENSGPRVGPIVISEVHYHPSGSDDLEFLEICNPTAAAVNLWEHWFVDGEWRDYPWKLESFEFPVGTTLAPGESLVVVPFDPAETTLLDAFESHYGLAGSGVQILGGYGPYLDDDGEAVRLWRPDEPPPEEPAWTPYLLEDEVRYDNEAPWPTGPDGGGTSLQRLSAAAWGNSPESWSAADPTPGDADINPPPYVVSIILNPDPLRTVRTVSDIEPSGIGVDTVRVTFNEAVTFTAANVVAEKVFVDESGDVSVTETLSPAVGGSGTTEMTIHFPSAWQNVIDTWVRIRLTGGVIDADGHALDGEPRLDSSNLGYIYTASADLPTGDGTAGGDAVFYVGSLRADMRGFGPFQPNPNGIVDQWDLNGFTSKYTQGDLDADFRGFGPFQPAPDGNVDQWDLNGFTSAYTSALTQGKRLWALPTAPEEMAPAEALSAPLAVGDPVAVFAPETSLLAADVAVPALVLAEGFSQAFAANVPATQDLAADDAYAGVLTVSPDGASGGGGGCRAPTLHSLEPAPAVWSPASSEPSTAGEAVDLLAGPALEVALTV